MAKSDIIVLIHGLGNNNLVWKGFSYLLKSQGFSVIAPNLRYHGPGEFSNNLKNTSLTDYEQDLERLVLELKVKPIIIGYSMGGLLTLKLLSKGLGKMGICIAPAAPRGINAISLSVIRIFLKNILVWRFWNRVHRPNFSSAYYGAFSKMSKSEAKEIFDEIATYESGRVGFELGFPYLDKKRASDLNEKKIVCPLLIIGARRDRVTPIGIARKLYKKCSHVAEYKEFYDYGHWLLGGEELESVFNYCLSWIKIKNKVDENDKAGKPKIE